MSSDDVTLAEAVRLALDTRQRNLHTALPGKVASYDAGTQTASIDLLVELAVPSRSKGVAYEKVPTLNGVPVGHPRGGGFVVHFPLAAGDHVWVMFSERSLDEVIKNGSRARPQDQRMHNLSFAYAIPSGSPAERDQVEGLPADTLVIGREDDEECQIRVSSTGIVLSGGGSTGPVALADKVHAAISAMLAAGIGVAGTQAFAAAKVAWDAATLGAPLPPGAPDPPPGLAPVGATKVTAE
jgi:hypothetical protein